MLNHKLDTMMLFLILTSNIHWCNAVKPEINLRLYERRIISQNGEDGVLEKIFDIIGTTNKYYVEFGAGNGHFCSNTKYLREKYGWTGLLLEGSRTHGDIELNLHHAFITAENICDLFRKYDVPKEFDLISIDIDGNDFYVWKTLSAYYRPRVVVIEFNQHFNFDDDSVMVYNPSYIWNSSEAFGAGILAFFNLGRKIGYSLVHQESSGANLFFIRDDVLSASDVKFLHVNDVSKLYTGRVMNFNRRGIQFISSAKVLN
jgi:hypothetical protein